MHTTLAADRNQSRTSVQVFDDHEAMSAAGAELISRLLEQNPRLLICLATGSTPARTFELLGAEADKSPALFGGLRVLKLDEWAGLPEGDPGSCETYLQHRVIRPWGISADRFFGFVPTAIDLEEECERVKLRLAQDGPIDLCVLGLGLNGHLGLNEPGPFLLPNAHPAELAEESRRHSMLSHLTDKPRFGMTVGMADILQSRQILLLVSGAAKREALARLLEGEISTSFPASFLCLHPQTFILCDRAAAGPG